ncbi:hypothetical protein ID866_5090 [Astraeus odoratus]|nr:hypothetical protein ID866_5090 [Astraeus odoratus]
MTKAFINDITAPLTTNNIRLRIHWLATTGGALSAGIKGRLSNCNAINGHINPEVLIRESKDKKRHHHLSGTDPSRIAHPYNARYGTSSIPKFHIPSKGISAEAAYQLIHEELNLDGSPSLNLASFVNTFMPEPGTKLVMENLSKNLVDQDEYPMTRELLVKEAFHALPNLWHAPSTHQAIGTATTGSSEAIQLGGLAMKRLWQERRKAAGKSIYEPGPNIVMGANAQVALEKFARYFEVECRLVPVSAESKYRLDPKKAMEYVDENTIGIYVILGSTYTGHYEPVKQMSDLLDEYEKNTGISVPIHVDAASGGFVAPFAHPKLAWDFRIPRVVSINTSGHKFGLAYVGVGWAVWRSKQYLPKDLIFELHYLGSVEYSFSLNFSRPAHPIIAQYFNFIQLGFDGYRTIALADLKNARLLSRALERTGWYTVLSDIHRYRSEGSLAKSAQAMLGVDEENPESYVEGLPVVAFRFSDDFQQKHPEIQQRWIQTLLRSRGWIVPNYELPPTLENVQILRVVVREHVSEALIDKLVADIVEVTQDLIDRKSSAHALDILGGQSDRGASASYSVAMGGPNLEIFKFGLYLFVPVAALLHFGDPQWYHNHVLPVCGAHFPPSAMSNPTRQQYKEQIFPRGDKTHMQLPTDQAAVKAELARIKAEKLARKMDRDRIIERSEVTQPEARQSSRGWFKLPW